MEPVLCPLCKLPTLERLLAKAGISAKLGSENTEHKILAFRCTEYNHLFFVGEAEGSTPFKTGTDRVPDLGAVSTGVPCPLCRGSGFDDAHENFCSTCEGTGELSVGVQKTIRCPLCTRYQIERVLGEVTVTAKIDGETSTLKGMLAFRCLENLHLFLAPRFDVEIRQQAKVGRQ